LALVTDWEEFAYLPWEEVGRCVKQKIIVDGRNMLPAEELRRLGFVYIGVGV
jgi:UDPglucose 6-dehydrogenase